MLSGTWYEGAALIAIGVFGIAVSNVNARRWANRWGDPRGLRVALRVVGVIAGLWFIAQGIRSLYVVLR